MMYNSESANPRRKNNAHLLQRTKIEAYEYKYVKIMYVIN